MRDGKRNLFALEYDAKGFILSLVILIVVISGGWIGYVQVFTKGLERLPARVCDGAVSRDLAVDLLPPARSARDSADGEKYRRGDGSFVFNCRIYASNDSILSGWVQVDHASVEEWADHYDANLRRKAVRVSFGKIWALAQLNERGTSSVYVPCYFGTTGTDEKAALHVLIADAAVIGESRLAGAELRQAVTDFAYQLTKRAYALGECDQGVDFPARLPRYREAGPD
ncbi:hypothetical protein [Streptomyces salinarius]|uniref:hypothetical protein n=1 Tax=Streptomyces salinarius TaxID=2762598 RepID=UPI001645391D|nr:hypothetical protein [Streptomyces salinarius]